jgi:hypothetical protein
MVIRHTSALKKPSLTDWHILPFRKYLVERKRRLTVLVSREEVELRKWAKLL